jgi:hypothetical protein
MNKGNNFVEEKRSIDIKDIPKPTFPKRTSVTRCCDILAKIKSLVHECTKSTALEKLEKDLKLALKDFESNISKGTTTSGITLSAPDRRTVPQRKRKNQEQKQANTACPLKKRKMKKSTLPAVKPKKVHPFNKRSGQHAQMMRKYYKTNISIEEMMGTEIMRQTRLRLVNGKSLTDWCNNSVMRITIYKQIRGTCLQRCSGCRHIELSKCPICKVELQMGDTRFQCRRCCQSYHAICLKADQKPPVKEQSNEWVFYCPPIHVTLGGQVHQS